DRTAILHPFGPAQIEAAPGEGGSYHSRDVWPAFGPVDAQPTEATALRLRGRQVDSEPGEESGARPRDLGGLVADRDVFACDQGRGEINAQAAGQVVVADSRHAQLAALTGEGPVSRPVLERNRHDPLEHLGDPRRREAEIAVPAGPHRRHQSDLGELRQMRAGGLPRHPRGVGQLGGGQSAAIEKRRQHGRSRRLSAQPRDLGHQRPRPRNHRRNVAPGPAAPQATPVDASITVEVFIGAGAHFGGKIAAITSPEEVAMLEGKTRIPPVDVETLPDDLRDTLEEQRKLRGAPLYPYLFYARNPAFFRAAKEMWAALQQGTTRVHPALRALLNRRVAGWNGCEF